MQSTGPDRVLTGRDGLVWRPKQKQLKQIAFVKAQISLQYYNFQANFIIPKDLPKIRYIFSSLSHAGPIIYPFLFTHQLPVTLSTNLLQNAGF